MKFLFLIILLVTLLSCKPEPEALNYGNDSCHTCKMTLMDKRFGAEIVTTKGKVYKFDDVNCMMTFLNSKNIEDREVAFRLVVDYAQPASLTDAGHAFYLKSPEIKSPMASQVAAFSSKTSMDDANEQWKGIYLTWGELVAQFK